MTYKYLWFKNIRSLTKDIKGLKNVWFNLTVDHSKWVVTEKEFCTVYIGLALATSIEQMFAYILNTVI